MSDTVAAARRAELADILRANGGTITPALMVEYAANPTTALHSLFTWDDSEAAQKYREVEAQTYLRMVVRLIPRADGESVAVRAFVSLTSDRGAQGVYRAIEDVLSDDEKRAQLVADAMGELRAMKAKYGHLQELARVWEHVDELRLVAA